MQAWWQKKISIYIGIGGALLLMLLSPMASLVWSLYDVLRDPLTMLMASDAPYNGVFGMYQIVAVGLILISLFAVYTQYKSRRQEVLAEKLQQVALAFTMYMAISLIGFNKMAQIALKSGLTALDAANVAFISIIVVTLWSYGKAAFVDGQNSLGNAVQLLAILFGLFHVLIFVVGLLGWPLQGFFDILALDTLAAAFGFIFWYHGRKTAV